jgi:extradiol dioxygenase family protein
MELFHLAMSQRHIEWTISKTAESFGCSIGLVSENLRLAHYIHEHPLIMKIETRQAALKRMNNNGARIQRYKV